MNEHILTISDRLWLIFEEGEFTHPLGDNLFYIRDDTGHNTLIDRDEIPALIDKLKEVQAFGKAKAQK